MLKVLETKDASGQRNGALIAIWNELEDDWRPAQVYVTTVNPGCRKGPHLHLRRTGRFVCVAGAVTMRIRTEEGEYLECQLRVGPAMCMTCPPGTPVQFRNDGAVPAILINLPSPAWSAVDPDEHPVEDWRDAD